MKKQLTLALIMLCSLLHAAEPESAVVVYKDTAQEQLATLPDNQQALAKSIFKDPIPDTLPDIIPLGVSWEEWRNVRTIAFLTGNSNEKPLSKDPQERQSQREYLIQDTVISPYFDDPFALTSPARADKNGVFHSWKAVKTFLNPRTAFVMLDWILPNFEKMYKAAPRDNQITYRMAVRTALTYLQEVDFAAETAYLEKIENCKDGSLRPTNFWRQNADGSPRDFGYVKTFLYRRYADKTFTKDEMIALVMRIDEAMSKWGPR